MKNGYSTKRVTNRYSILIFFFFKHFNILKKWSKYIFFSLGVGERKKFFFYKVLHFKLQGTCRTLYNTDTYIYYSFLKLFITQISYFLHIYETITAIYEALSWIIYFFLKNGVLRYWKCSYFFFFVLINNRNFSWN